MDILYINKVEEAQNDKNDFSKRSCKTDGEMTAWQWVSVEEMLAMDVFPPTLIAINLFLEKCEL